MLQRIKDSSSYKWWATGALGLGMLMTVSDFGAVGIALPYIADNFNSDLPTVQWLVVGHMLSISVLLLPMGRLSDIVGRKRIYLWGLAACIVGAGLAGTASTLTALILFRLLQGIGPGMIQANQMAILTSVFPAKERGKALGLHLTIVGMGAVIGPAIGGVLVSAFGWRSVFLINVPLIAVSLIVAALVLDERKILDLTASQRRGKFDWPGAVLIGMAVLAFLLVMTNGHRFGWSSPLILGILVLFLVLLATFIWWELRLSEPLLNLSLFKNPLFAYGVACRSLSFISIAATFFLMPFYLQGVGGYGPGQAGLIMTPMAVAMIVVSAVVGPLSDRFGAKPFVVGGSVVTAAGMFLLVGLTMETSLSMIMIALILQSIGMSAFFVPNSSSILGVVDKSRYSIVSAFLQLLRNVSNIIGITIATLVVTISMTVMGFDPALKAVSDIAEFGVKQAFTSGLRTIYFTMGVIQIAVLIISLVSFKSSAWTDPDRSSDIQINSTDSDEHLDPEVAE